MKNVLAVLVMILMTVMVFSAPESIEGDWNVIFLLDDYKTAFDRGNTIWRFTENTQQQIDEDKTYEPNEYVYDADLSTLFIKGEGRKQLPIIFRNDNVFVIYPPSLIAKPIIICVKMVTNATTILQQK